MRYLMLLLLFGCFDYGIILECPHSKICMIEEVPTMMGQPLSLCKIVKRGDKKIGECVKEGVYYEQEF